ncbi:hypothetical protein [Bacillus cereus group sp. BY5-1LC]|uniref:hypothetical protein n=1 Tax=Bacillus cereus group sp. BY5-1LC TaxID=3018078 RepID=UPI0022E6212C|nr:hypothetical protein [Bacillus cereus group sp. BY5-1LC]MDA1792127.1 hypothetical protein [Bacillus cereus group sp. BY5-1LC]
MGNVFTRTWEQTLEANPGIRDGFEKVIKLFKVEKVEIKKGAMFVNDWYAEGYFERQAMFLVVKFKGEERRIRFMAFFQPDINEWVTTESAPTHLEGKCHVCKHFNAAIADDNSFCPCISVVDLKYLLEQIKQMKEHRLHFVL